MAKTFGNNVAHGVLHNEELSQSGICLGRAAKLSAQDKLDALFCSALNESVDALDQKIRASTQCGTTMTSLFLHKVTPLLLSSFEDSAAAERDSMDSSNHRVTKTGGPALARGADGYYRVYCGNIGDSRCVMVSGQDLSVEDSMNRSWSGASLNLLATMRRPSDGTGSNHGFQLNSSSHSASSSDQTFNQWKPPSPKVTPTRDAMDKSNSTQVTEVSAITSLSTTNCKGSSHNDVGLDLDATNHSTDYSFSSNNSGSASKKDYPMQRYSPIIEVEAECTSTLDCTTSILKSSVDETSNRGRTNSSASRSSAITRKLFNARADSRPSDLDRSNHSNCSVRSNQISVRLYEMSEDHKLSIDRERVRIVENLKIEKVSLPQPLACHLSTESSYDDTVEDDETIIGPQSLHRLTNITCSDHLEEFETEEHKELHALAEQDVSKGFLAAGSSLKEKDLPDSTPFHIQAVVNQLILHEKLVPNHEVYLQKKRLADNYIKHLSGFITSDPSTHQFELCEQSKENLSTDKKENWSVALVHKNSFVDYRRSQATGAVGPLAYFGRYGLSFLMSRSLGDKYGPRGCIAQADITAVTVHPHQHARFITCSDGVWDVIDSETIRRLALLSPFALAQDLASSIAFKARKRRAALKMRQDDITVIVLDLFPQNARFINARHNREGQYYSTSKANALSKTAARQGNSIPPIHPCNSYSKVTADRSNVEEINSFQQKSSSVKSPKKFFLSCTSESVLTDVVSSSQTKHFVRCETAVSMHVQSSEDGPNIHYVEDPGASTAGVTTHEVTVYSMQHKEASCTVC